ncbi:alpha/beta hydrolase [Truepera radiovictrix]|uniref:Phospholipase/Carboxylesterase n=1 Tax=Truepera radiovictrix (strain DSM 17093 / CIP 108686 / LMG 22925 / RQ-24) TaxID=649638 RepID=D7CWX1_TRURR|nr:phospholipase/carboxylesterase [Truepera radiovictrix]ADI14479.1 phospholipase/Carboxylesterase [Truepera radiovictrix DSM 17093]WMT56966.1 hypothetical protein RCV51_13225 [Truepera radiovictrix]
MAAEPPGTLLQGRFQQPLSYRFDLWRPAGPLRGPLLVCLHGYGQSKRASLAFGQRVRHGGPVAALQAPHPHHRRTEAGLRVGFSWVGAAEAGLYEPDEDLANHHRFVQHVIARAHAEGLAAAPRAFLFGFSQSVSLNYRFAAAHPELLLGVIAVAGATPSAWERAAPRLGVPVLHIAPTDDEAYPRARAQRFRERLAAATDDLTWLEPPGGHRVPSACYPVMRRWLLERARP